MSQLIFNSGAAFPANWDPRYTLAQGLGANPDHREDYKVHQSGPRIPSTNLTGGLGGSDFYVNPTDATDGFLVNGTLPVSADQYVLPASHQVIIITMLIVFTGVSTLSPTFRSSQWVLARRCSEVFTATSTSSLAWQTAWVWRGVTGSQERETSGL